MVGEVGEVMKEASYRVGGRVMESFAGGRRCIKLN